MHNFHEDIAKRNDKLRQMSQSYAFGFQGRKSQYAKTFTNTNGGFRDPITVNDFQECDMNGNLNLKSSYDYNTQKLG